MLAKDKRTAANGVELQHRHFAFIAATLKSQRDNTKPLSEARLVVEQVIRGFAIECANSNPRFDRGRFMAACGMEG